MELLGLATCDTCRSARRALSGAGHDVEFRDIRKNPLSAADIAVLLAAHGPDLVNRRSATWRGLSEADRRADPAMLLQRHPALMKRPVIRVNGDSWLGWTSEVQAAFGAG